MKRGKKSRKRKRGPVSQARIRERERLRQEHERKQRRLAELEEETREYYESVIEQYPLSERDQQNLEGEWKLGLEVIAEYEDATRPYDYHDLFIYTYDSEPLSNYIDTGMGEAAWRASFDLANALGLAMVTIDEAGNINGEIVEY